MSGKRLTRNALMAVIQVLVSGGVLFFLYRYLLQTLGSEQVGIWSIVLATASVSRISELGITASAVKFTAKYIARDEKNKAAEVIQTTAITIAVVLFCVLLAGYPVIAWLLGKVVPTEKISTAIEILPYALGSIWISSIAGVALSALDGCQRIDLRGVISVLGNLSFLGLTWYLVPGYGLFGVAWAQIGQAILTLLGCWFLLRRELPSLSLMNLRWRRSLFLEMLQYGFNFQLISIFIMLVEPITKSLMSKFGGLTSVAYYEMASRMVSQFRLLLVSANQVMVPHVASQHEVNSETVKVEYLKSYKIIFALSLPIFVGVAEISPLVSELWIGHYESKFVTYAALLSAGLWVNTLSGPAYFTNLGTGMLKWNVIGHIILGVVNIVFGYVLGHVLGGVGVVIGYLLALIIGSGSIIYGYHYDNHISVSELFPHESKKLFLSGCVGLLMGCSLFYLISNINSSLLRESLFFVASITPVIFVFWFHPCREWIWKMILITFFLRRNM
jgi:O-antigen/teichoic acid export membrane protein